MATPGYIFVSDLHLAAGRKEEFFYDQVFARFLDHLTVRARVEGRCWQLVLLGDIFDFLRVTVPDGASSDQQKLNAIAGAHPAFFQALGRFVAGGASLAILPGNHDIELVRPAVQDHLRQLILPAAGRDSAGLAERVTFYPWLMIVPGLLYAEHGQQYHDLNSFYTLMQSDGELPFGSLFETYLDDLIQAGAPGAAQIPNLPSAARTLVRHPAAWLPAFAISARFLRATAALLLRRSGQAGVRRRVAYHASFQSAAVSLPVDLLRALDGLAAVSLPGAVPRLLRERFNRAKPGQPAGYLYSACVKIDRLLRSQGLHVPFYVFGHTHHSVKWPLSSPDGAAAWYLNSGSWTTPARTFGFIEVHPGPPPTAEIRGWNDATGRCEP